MASHNYGDSNLPVTQSTRVRRTANTSNGTSSTLTGFTVEVVFISDSSAADSLIPSLGSSYGSPYSNALLTESEKEPYKVGLTRITLIYTAQSDSTPPTSYSESSSQISAPIQEHPNFLDFADKWDDENQRWLASSGKTILSYIRGSTQIVRREYFSSMPSSDRGNIGYIENPGGPYTGDSDKFILVGSNISLQGSFWVKENTYLYSQDGWDSDFYSSP